MFFLLPIILNISSLQFVKTEVIKTGYGTKSVLISPDRKNVYALNLEDMSVYEFDRKTKKLERILRFKKTPGTGYNYTEKKWIHSYQEKPVEGCFTHQGRYLWISLHNAGGIVAWDLKDSLTSIKDFPHKKVFIKDLKTEISSSGDLPFFKTGKTPKIIAKSRDEKYLFVSNWHSSTVSVIDISANKPIYWKKIKDIPTGRLPRGLAISEDNKLLYIAQMGSALIKIIEIGTWKEKGVIHTAINPRHLFIDGHYLYVSINIDGEVMKIDLNTKKILKISKAGHLARTLALSPSRKYLFVVCYKDNILDVFKTADLTRVFRLKTGIHPVGVAVYQNGDSIEAWVCNYSGSINVFTFKENLN